MGCHAISKSPGRANSLTGIKYVLSFSSFSIAADYTKVFTVPTDKNLKDCSPHIVWLYLKLTYSMMHSPS